MSRTKIMTKESGGIQRREVGRDVVYQAVREGIQKALEMIRERFEDSEHQDLEEFEGFFPEVRGKVAALFPLFDQSIQATKELAEKRKKMSFEVLVGNMGYVLER